MLEEIRKTLEDIIKRHDEPVYEPDGYWDGRRDGEFLLASQLLEVLNEVKE